MKRHNSYHNPTNFHKLQNHVKIQHSNPTHIYIDFQQSHRDQLNKKLTNNHPSQIMAHTTQTLLIVDPIYLNHHTINLIIEHIPTFLPKTTELNHLIDITMLPKI